MNLTPIGFTGDDYEDESHMIELTPEQITARDAAEAEYGAILEPQPLCERCDDTGEIACLDWVPRAFGGGDCQMPSSEICECEIGDVLAAKADAEYAEMKARMNAARKDAA